MKIKYLCTTNQPLGDIIYLINYQKFLIFKESKVQVFNSNIQCDFELKEVKIKNNEEKSKIAHLITIESDSKEVLEKISSQFRATFFKLSNYSYIELSNDVDKEYSKDIYPKIHNIENKLRTIITLIMTINTEIEWNTTIKNYFPNEKDKDFNCSTFFYKRDFDELRRFLFTTIQFKDIGELTDEIDDFILESKKELKNNKSEIGEDSFNKKIEELKSITNNYKQYSFWDTYLKKIADSKKIQRSNVEKIMTNLYKNRCKIAHNNKFEKKDYEETTQNCKDLEKILDVFIESIINMPIKESISGTKDTLIVPANEGGFDRVFIGENSWYSVRISNEKIGEIKYIAAYQTSPISAVTYYAEVDKIVDSDEDINKKKIIFKNPAQKLEKPIKLKNAFPPRGSRYTQFNKLKTANNFEELF